MKKKIIVVGGGAAGLMAAGRAAERGHEVHLYEKNNRIGKKILITGKGRCNVTNVADIDDFFKQIPRNPRFLNAAARQFTHEDVTGLLEMLGTPTKVERGGRVFPESDKASDVTRALDRGMRDAGVVISLNTQVAHVRQAESGFDVELAQAVCARLGWTLQYQSIANRNAYVELSSGNVDCAWGGMVLDQTDSKDSKKKQKMTLTAPYLENRLLLIVRGDSKYRTAGSLKGTTVLLGTDETYMTALSADEKLMKAFGAAQRVTGGSKACFEALSAGDCAAIVADSTALAYYTH